MACVNVLSMYDIGIVGCGIAGSATAFLLAEQGHNVALFEQASHCGPVGAGLLLQPSGQAVLRECGLLDAITAQSAVIRQLHAVTVSGKQLTHLPYDELGADVHALGVQRGVLFTSLFDRCHAAGVDVREGHRIVRREVVGDEVFVSDATGTSHGPFDFLIATDGSASDLRSSVGLRCCEQTYRHAAMWYVGRNDEVSNRLHQVVSGTQVLIGLLPTGNGRCSLFWGEPHDQWQRLRDRGIDAWKQTLLGYCPQAAQTIEEIRSFDDLTFATYRHVRMRHWFDRHTLFLGDAAHAMSPHLGQGANLALVDAMTFATSLAQSDSFTDACARFVRERRSIVRYYSQLTRLLTPFFQSDHAILGWGRDIFLPWLPRLPWVRRQMLLTMAGLKQGWTRDLW